MHDVLAQYNPWGSTISYGVDRLFYYQQIVELLHRREIQVLSGIRRCGKTTILKQCMRYLVDSGVTQRHILYIPCDDPLLRLKTFDDLHKLILSFVDGDNLLYVFLDEIQVIPGWEKYLKGRYDANVNMKFMITGSTASFFAKDVANYLTGRYFFHHITTLQYVEYKRFKPSGTLLEYLEWGGFPEVVRAGTTKEKSAILQTYLDTILERDIVDRCAIRNRAVAKDFFKSLLLVVGGKIVADRLAKQFKLDSRSVNRYIAIAIDSFLLYQVRFFSTSMRKNRFMPEKLYSCDAGFTRLLAKRFEQGHAAEWAVLHKVGAASYWSNDDGEVDFVTDNDALQVTFTDIVPEREFKGLLMFKKIYPKKGVVIAKQTTTTTIALEEFLSQEQ